MKAFTENEKFTGLTTLKANSTFEDCEFRQCNFQSCKITDINFINVHFIDCDLSLAVFRHVKWQQVSFTNCKLMGVKQPEISKMLLSVKFINCNLMMMHLEGLALQRAVFKSCNLKEAILIDCDLRESNFEDSHLAGALIHNCDLRKADFQWATAYQIDPGHNQLKGAVFSESGLSGLLQHLDIKINP
ncbi:pentapeptide repeat-containing protein [Persicobacter psychrovividus]|uniref:Pentapeptide repeat protein n=1 Tax=Persicobacter psychrovividus TaxID=387638 RepID=A0ABN6LCM4_9BACT|nr:pentapeptide repeat protein [Persicobacter psychrovividus]